MLMKSYAYFDAQIGNNSPFAGSARLQIGDHPRARALRSLKIASRPLSAAYLSSSCGILDDRVESWFLS